MSQSKGKKHVSQRQLEANQRNAQKSTGPTTEAGRNTSRYNGLQHGLCSELVCIPGESHEAYQALRRQYIDYYQPQHRVEADFVDDLVAARWRQHRVVRSEMILITLEVTALRQDPAARVTGASPDVESAVAVQTLADLSHSLKLFDRYEARYERCIRRTSRLLKELQAERPPAGPVPAAPVDAQTGVIPQPDPTPAPEPPATHNEKSPTEPIPTNGHLPASRPRIYFDPTVRSLATVFPATGPLRRNSPFTALEKSRSAAS